jgi:hypothetical protein
VTLIQRLSQVRAQLIEKHCHGCHSDFNVKSGMTDAQRDEAVMRFMLHQDGWVYPGDPQAGRLHTRVWGKGSEKVMPADGLKLIANDRGYRQLLETLDLLVATMVPGQRKRVQSVQSLTLRNRTSHACGSIPNKTIVVVVDKNPNEMPGFSRIFRPADQYLNGECVDGDGYYVTGKTLGNP